MNIDLRQTLQTISEQLEANNIGFLLSRNPTNVRYLTECTVHGAGDALILVSPSDVTVFTDSRYEAEFKRTIGDNPQIKLVILNPKTVWEDILKPIPHGTRAGFEKTSPYTTYNMIDKLGEAAFGRSITFAGVDDIIMSVRMIKTAKEIEIMKEAFGLSDAAFNYITGRIAVGRTEREIAQELNAYMREHSGSDELSFATIVASGPNGDAPHASVTDRKLSKGDLITIDFGLVYRGYHTDTTRTVALGNPNDQLREIYAIVQEAQQAVADQVEIGMTGIEADKIARDIIAKAGYGEQFGHGTGHGVGLDEHELPRLSYTDPGKNILQDGSVFSIEPAIYLPGIGGVRIEDVGILTAAGFLPLTKLPKHLIIL